MRSMTGDSDQEARAAGLPPMAVPMTVKIPEPMTMPTPSAVSEMGPRVLRRACVGRSDSVISLSMDLVAKICLGSVGLLGAGNREQGVGNSERRLRPFDN